MVTAMTCLTKSPPYEGYMEGRDGPAVTGQSRQVNNNVFIEVPRYSSVSVAQS